MGQEIQQALVKLFWEWAGEGPETIEPLPQSGSYRKYYRLKGPHATAIGAYNEDVQENYAFISHSNFFKKKGLNVPEIFSFSVNGLTYLMEDLGNRVVLDHLVEIREKQGFNDEIRNLYRNILDELIRFQIVAGRDMDFSKCCPLPESCPQTYKFDLNYFKYDFLKFLKVPFDENFLELSFTELTNALMKAPDGFFLYRDFQARNIMLHQNKLYFIDYQAGRKGPVHYDVASLLFQAKADIPFEVREELIDYYIEQAGKVDPDSVKDFREHFYNFALVRVLQTLGAYGFRGLFERKAHFIESIPLALKNIKWLLEQKKVDSFSELKKCLTFIVEDPSINQQLFPPLNVQINSFSYKRGIPVDLSYNGGGFVFDCRALPNPGRLEKFRSLTGMDEEIIKYLEQYNEVGQFLNHIYHLVINSIKVYTGRRFTGLMISFGCTGGRHRSVYCAQKLAMMLESNKGIQIEIRHREQEKG